ncbi:unnamed protein product [Ranitomeya imitator]|uniref:Helix-turn-helix domain-containing protein n=1 Tax=Ranitomeya imitator TaxID=111125 RepID=A0ABN9LD16_9NEOB|nr:unnamed protein product [Ranitomeya imitator]
MTGNTVTCTGGSMFLMTDAEAGPKTGSGLWERNIFQTDPHPLSQGVVSWWRYIDDILMVWQGTKRDLEQFISILNSNVKNIKLTFKYDTQQIDFLDISIKVGVDGTICTDLFRKTTSVNSLLHSSSQHPRHLIRNIPTGQFLRARRICSQEDLFEHQAQDLWTRFRDRGYGKKTICRSYQRAYHSQRSALLRKQIAVKDQDQGILSFDGGHRRKRASVQDLLADSKHIRQLKNSNSGIPIFFCALWSLPSAALYVAQLYMEHLWGNNERFFFSQCLKKD